MGEAGTRQTPGLPRQWQELRALFERGQHLSGPMLQEFLDAHCGSDLWLRRQLEGMVLAYQKPDPTLEHPLPERLGGIASPADNLTGLILNDRYEVREEIGPGGSSMVYLPADSHLAGRKVVI